MPTIVRDHWILQRARVSCEIIDPHGFPESGLLLEERWGEETFLPNPAGMEFSAIVVEASESSRYVMIDMPKLEPMSCIT